MGDWNERIERREGGKGIWRRGYGIREQKLWATCIIIWNSNTLKIFKIYTYVKIIKMRSQNKGADRVPMDTSCHQMKLYCNTSKVLYQIELFTKVFSWKPINKPDCCQRYRLLPTNLWQCHIAEENTYTICSTYKIWTGAYTELSLHVLESLVKEGTVQGNKGKMYTSTQQQNLSSTMVSCLNIF